jgi:ribosomal protein S18 acetylase RimI-like enzyme
MEINYRNYLVRNDREELKQILESTGVFYDFEVTVALEIVDDYLEKNNDSEYSFIVAESDGRVLGYVNFGPTPCTQISWDVYWIAVSKEFMNMGLGRILLNKAEETIRDRKGVNIWVETSSRKDYEPTRAFYLKRGYNVVSELNDFYSRGDNKVIFHKVITENLFLMVDKAGENISVNGAES